MIVAERSNCTTRQIPDASRSYIQGSRDELDRVVRDVLDWFIKEDNKSWLLIFDNIDQDYLSIRDDKTAYNVEEYFPGGDHGSVLVTTRLAKLGQLGTSMKLKAVDDVQARSMMANSLGRTFEESDESKEILELLNGLPLAITQSAAFMRETGLTVAKYLDLYRNEWKALTDDTPLRSYPNGSIQTTWTVSYQAIKKRNEVAANLMQLWAYLDHKDLWFGLLHRVSGESSLREILPQWFQDIISSEVKFTKAIRELLAFSMIEAREDMAAYSVHPVVHEWALQTLGQERKAELSWLTVVVVGHAFPSSMEREIGVMQQRLIPHADCCYRWVESGEDGRYLQIDNGSERGEALIKFHLAVDHLGLLYFDLGMPGKAEKMSMRALKDLEEALGDEHPLALNAVINLGNVYVAQGKLAKAEEMYKRILKAYQNGILAGNDLILYAVQNMGTVYRAQGKLSEAEKIYGTFLKIYEAAAAENIITLKTVNNLGCIYADQGKLTEAEEMYKRALEDKEKALGAEHTSTLHTVNNLGKIYYSQGKLAEAEKMYKRALNGFGKIYGDEHPSILTVVHNLGNLYYNQGKLNEAEKMSMRALDGRKKALRAEHTSTLDTVHNLGLLYYNQGKLAEAEKMYKRALEGREKALGAEHTSTLDTVNNLGVLCKNQGKLVDAETMYKRALEGREKALGAEHTSTLDTVNNLGNLYYTQGKLAEAGKMYKRALDGREQALGAEHTSTLDTVHNLGLLYYNQGKLAEAEKMSMRALDGREKALGAEHTSTLDTVNNLGNLYYTQGKLAEAGKMYKRALDGREKALGAEHTSTLDTVYNLGLLYYNQGKLNEAEKMYERALKGYEKALNTNHTSTINTAIMFGRLLLQRCSNQNLQSERVISQTVKVLSELIKLACKWGRKSPTFFGFLGRALLWASDELNAQTAFQKQIDLQEGVWVHANIICDGCHLTVSCAMKRFICKRCPDVDICGECFRKREMGIKVLSNCSEHSFLEILPEVLSRANEFAFVEGTKRDLWLQKVMTKYSEVAVDQG